MFKKSVSIVVLASFLSLIGSSCAGDRLSQPEKGPGSATDAERLDGKLSTSPEVRELLRIRDDIISRAIDRGITAGQMRAAGSDPRRSNELLGLSGAEASALGRRIETLVGALYDRHPELRRLVEQEASASGCRACDADRLIASWDARAAAFVGHRISDAASSSGAGLSVGAGISLAPERAPLTCKWTQLVVGMALCALKSGGSLLFYAICSYGVFCGSCDGGAADAICS
jgi:hypothetical protein